MSENKPSHIHQDVWHRVLSMSVTHLVGQLAMYDPTVGKLCTGKTIEELTEEGLVGTVMNIAVNNLTETSSETMLLLKLQELAIEKGHPPLLCAADFQRGACVIGPSGLGAPNSWNPRLIERTARRAAEHSAISGVSLIFSPVADHSFGTKQGRNQEGGAVESPLLMSAIVAAMVRGYQSENLLDKNAIAATVKHVGPYQMTEGPDYQALPISYRAFLEDCWPTFEAGLREGARAVMMSFVALDGTPSHASEYLANLVRKHGRPGTIIISDFTGINELVEFGVAGSPREAALLAFTKGGIHLDLNGGVYTKELPGLVEAGDITLLELQYRVADVMQLKYDLGLFDDFQKYAREPLEIKRLTESVSEYRELAEESIVLLKPKVPDSRILPIPKEARILVTGPIANRPKEWVGEWCGNALSHLDSVITAYAGIKDLWPGAELMECENLEAPSPDLTLMKDAKPEHIIVFLGERQEWSGESKVRLEPRIPRGQVRFVEKLRNESDAVIHVCITAGRPLAIPAVLEQCADSIFWVPQLGSFAGEAIANILSGKANPSGRLACSLPCHESVTSGFSHRESRKGRPAAPFNEATWQYRHATGWNTHYQELGERGTLAGYRFGEGYSYTQFEYSDWKLSSPLLSVESHTPLIAEVRVANIGLCPGKETVQLYAHDSVSVVVPRELALLAWKQVTLNPRESRVIRFKVWPRQLALYGVDLEEGRLPRPDSHPVYLFIAKNSGEFMSIGGMKKKTFFDPYFRGCLKFILTK